MFYNTIARYYDAENATFTDDLELYLELADEYGDPIMEVGCGTGRVLAHLAQAGYECVGVDYSPEMLAVARRKFDLMPDVSARLVEADILQFKSEHKFPLILLPYNALMHFHEPEMQTAVLKHLHGLLAEDGIIAIDLPNAGEAFASQGDGSVMLERTFHEPVNGNLVMQQSVSHIDLIQQLLHITWLYDEIDKDGTVKRTLAPLTLRYVFAAELNLLLELCGFESLAAYGDYERNPIEDGCERVIVLAKKKQ